MSDPLDELDRKIKDARHRQDAHTKPSASQQSQADTRAMGMAMRVGVEMLAGLMVGGGLGYLIDQGFDTKPWGMVVMLVLGFCAGILNVYRTVAGLGMSVGYRDSLSQAKKQADEAEKQNDGQSGE